ncbi:MAG: FtsX-like permease family protein, partial [Acidobacteriota bacterium]
TATAAPTEVEAKFVSSNCFSVLGVVQATGQLFFSDPAPPSAVISHSLWQQQFGGAAGALGKTVRLDGRPVTLAGVAPEGFRGLGVTDSAADVWLPISSRPILQPMSFNPLERLEGGGSMVWLQVVARRAEGAPLRRVQEELDSTGGAVAEEFPQWGARQDGVRALENSRFGPQESERIQRTLQLTFLIALLVLTVTAANVASLMLMRATRRRKEVAIRQALGGTVWSTARLLAAESFLLALAGGLGAWVLAWWSTGALATRLPHEFHGPMTPDGWALAASLAATLSLAAIFSGAPVLKTSKAGILPSLGSLDDARSHRRRDAIVVLQVALAVILIGAAGSLTRSLLSASGVELGFLPEGRAAVAVNLQAHGYDGPSSAAFLTQAIESIASLPVAESASTASMLPFRGTMQMSGRPAGREDAEIRLGANLVGPGFFKTMGIPLLAGREFDLKDASEGEPVAVLSRTAAEGLWPSRSAVGERIEIQGKARTVVGVVGDVRSTSLSQAPGPFLYLPMLQGSAKRFHLIVASRTDEGDAGPAAVAILKELEPGLVLRQPHSLTHLVDALLEPFRVTSSLTLAFSVLALFLAAMGLYGSLAQRVATRTKRIAIQRALGEPRQQIGRGYLLQSLRLTGFGIAAGLLGAWAVAERIDPWLFADQTARDPSLSLGVAFVVLATAALAGWLPARRAMEVDPSEVLRGD